MKEKAVKMEKETDINIDHVGWIQKFLYPYAIDPAPFKQKDTGHLGKAIKMLNQKKMKPGEQIDILTTDKFQFPIEFMDENACYLSDITNPIQMEKEEIHKEMYQYRKEFPIKIIPHIDENDEIVDNVHHYKQAKKPD